MISIKRLGDLRRYFIAGLHVALLGLLLQSTAYAQDAVGAAQTAGGGGKLGWKVTPALSVSEHYSDNIFLAPAGAERSEWTTRIIPAISVAGNSARLQLHATYAPELLLRANQNTTDLFHTLNATARAEILSRILFMDMRAGVFQQNVSLLGPQSDSNINSTANRGTNRYYRISPYLSRQFDLNATGELRFTHDAERRGGGAGGTTSTGLFGSTSNRIDGTLASGPAYKLLTWNLALMKSRVDYSQTAQKIDEQRASVTVGPLISPEIRLIGNVGYEDSGYPSASGQKLKGTFWRVGPEWTPSQRTRISAAFGRRYFGNSRAFHLDHRARRAVWRLDYTEATTTARDGVFQQVLSPSALLIDAELRNDPNFQNPADRQREVVERVARIPGASLTEPVNFLTDYLFLDKRLQGTFGITGVKNTLTTSIFTSSRNALTSGAGAGSDFSASQTVKQKGLTLVWTSRLTETLNSNLSLAAYRSSFASLNRSSRGETLRWGLSKLFYRSLTGSVNLGRQQIKYSSDLVGYQENSASVTLSVRY